jgi:hypothetical protein
MKRAGEFRRQAERYRQLIRALTPLIREHVNPYGRFEHHMEALYSGSPDDLLKIVGPARPTRDKSSCCA